MTITSGITKARPKVEDRFFSLVIGLGYPPPGLIFRWCTNRLKIKPTKQLITQLASENEGVIVLLGTRDSESAQRKKSIEKNSSEYRYTEKPFISKVNNSVQKLNQYIYQPIRYFETNTVWSSLENGGLPWGMGYGRMKGLYRESSGECPLVADISTPRACGSRWGCWSCSLIQEDKSMLNFIESGNKWMKPLYDYRKFMIQVSNNPEMRLPYMYDRTTGKITKKDTKGGLNKKARRILFDELMNLRRKIDLVKPLDIDFEVITEEEINQIKANWAKIDNLEHWEPLAEDDYCLDFTEKEGQLKMLA